MKKALAIFAVIFAGMIVVGQIAGRSSPAPTPGAFATFERRIKSEVWGEGARKVKSGDFATSRDALKWLSEVWPNVEGESFKPLDAQEAKAGDDLEALAALWEAWSR